MTVSHFSREIPSNRLLTPTRGGIVPGVIDQDIQFEVREDPHQRGFIGQVTFAKLATPSRDSTAVTASEPSSISTASACASSCPSRTAIARPIRRAAPVTTAVAREREFMALGFIAPGNIYRWGQWLAGTGPDASGKHWVRTVLRTGPPLPDERSVPLYASSENPGSFASVPLTTNPKGITILSQSGPQADMIG